MVYEIANYKGDHKTANQQIGVTDDGMYLIFEIEQYNTRTKVKVRNVSDRRPESAIQIEIHTTKNGRTTIGSFSIPQELSELFIRAVSVPKPSLA